MVYVLCLAGRRPGLAKVSNGLALVMTDKFRGTPLRDVAGRHKISRSALSRYMPHIGQAIIKAQERREERLADNVFDGIKQLQDKALSLLGKMESDGDYRGAVLAAREAQECLLSANELLARAEALKAAGTLAKWWSRLSTLGRVRALPFGRIPNVLLQLTDCFELTCLCT